MIRSGNFFGNADRTSPNWTGVTPRTSRPGGAWAPDSRRIPKLAWLGAVVVVLVLLFLLPWVGHAAGLQ